MAIALEFVPSASRRLHRRKRRWLAGAGVLVFVVAFLWFIGVLGGNVREVESGRFYRSAQLSGTQLESVLARYGIRSVVNLRGPSKRAFYLSEVEICRESNVDHFDLSLSAYRLPKPEEVSGLLATLDRAPRPILIHCQQGADRSGLASTLYETVYEGVPLDEAERRQLTWRYGHFGFVGTWRMERFFDLYRQTAKGQSLRAWISTTYPKVYSAETIAK